MAAGPNTDELGHLQRPWQVARGKGPGRESKDRVSWTESAASITSLPRETGEELVKLQGQFPLEGDTYWQA